MICVTTDYAPAFFLFFCCRFPRSCTSHTDQSDTLEMNFSPGGGKVKLRPSQLSHLAEEHKKKEPGSWFVLQQRLKSERSLTLFFAALMIFQGHASESPAAKSLPLAASEFWFGFCFVFLCRRLAGGSATEKGGCQLNKCASRGRKKLLEEGRRRLKSRRQRRATPGQAFKALRDGERGPTPDGAAGGRTT